MKVGRRTIRMTGKVVLLILLIIANQVLNVGCSRRLQGQIRLSNGTEVSEARDPGSPSGPSNCTYVPGGGGNNGGHHCKIHG
ncbi:hypothetical protein SLEP1_g52714 [Rubroshorea leprosula]|uniref:Uncharacterized protein n=1 Tax=Rubroshorea leprosula TaxID=152421 RepID=A0AAV5M744_9ROSI|nr:hypothetical protein SLEP1_g52714 [Rubroshorea leprosula]